MKCKYFSVSLRFLYGICAEASVMQKPEAVKGRLEVIITPELGSSEFRQNVGVSRLPSITSRSSTTKDYDLKHSHMKQTLHLPNFWLESLITVIFIQSSRKLLISDQIQSSKKAKRWMAALMVWQPLKVLRESVAYAHLSKASYLHKQEKISPPTAVYSSWVPCALFWHFYLFEM